MMNMTNKGAVCRQKGRSRALRTISTRLQPCRHPTIGNRLWTVQTVRSVNKRKLRIADVMG